MLNKVIIYDVILYKKGYKYEKNFYVNSSYGDTFC